MRRWAQASRWFHGLGLLILCLGLAGWPDRAAAAEPKCEPAKIGTKYPSLAGKTFRSAIDPAGKPYAYRVPDDLTKITGLDAEFARAVFSCIGAPVEFVVGTLSGIVPAMAAGQIDLTFSHFIYTPERAQQVDFVLFYKVSAVIVVQKGNPKNIRSLNDLCGLRGATQLGSTEVDTLQRTTDACVAAHKGEIVVSYAPNRPSGLQQLQTDRIDALLGIGTAVTYASDLFDIAGTYVNGGLAGVGTRKGDKELQQAIFDAVTVLQANGEEKKLYETFEVDHAYAAPPKIVAQ